MKKSIVIFIFILAGLTLSPCYAKELTLSVLPNMIYDEVVNTAAYPLSSHLSVDTGLNVKPSVEPNIYRFKLNLKRKAYDIIFEDPGVGLPSDNSYEIICIALNKNKEPKQRGVVITTVNSGIGSVEDIKSRSICVTHMDSAGSYMSQVLAAQKFGIDVSSDCDVSEVPDNKIENVIMYVYFQDYEAGFIPEFGLHQLSKYVVPSQIRIIKTEWVPNWIVAIKKDLPQKTKLSIQRSLINLRLDRNSPLARGMDIFGFKAATNDVLKNLQLKQGIDINEKKAQEKNIL